MRIASRWSVLATHTRRDQSAGDGSAGMAVDVTSLTGPRGVVRPCRAKEGRVLRALRALVARLGRRRRGVPLVQRPAQPGLCEGPCRLLLPAGTEWGGRGLPTLRASVRIVGARARDNHPSVLGGFSGTLGPSLAR